MKKTGKAGKLEGEAKEEEDESERRQTDGEKECRGRKRMAGR